MSLYAPVSPLACLSHGCICICITHTCIHICIYICICTFISTFIRVFYINMYVCSHLAQATMSSFSAHSYFHEKREGTGHYRFCKKCFPVEPDLLECTLCVKEGGALSQLYPVGCVLNDSSTSSMIKHLRVCQQDVLPLSLRSRRTGLTDCKLWSPSPSPY